MFHWLHREVSNKSYRLGINVLARMMRTLIRVKGINGHFCIGANDSYFCTSGFRFVYHFSNFGVAGNIDSGSSTETETIEKLTEILAGDFVFFDIGAHEGWYTLNIRKKFPLSTIYAFEPDASSLRKNLQLNSVDDVKIVECAIGAEETTVVMTVNRRSSNFVDPGGLTGRKVEMKTIDQLIAKQLLKLPGAIKIDIEGFEFQALTGASKTLAIAHPIIVTEINACFKRYHQELGAWRSFMLELGYDLYSLRADKFELVSVDIVTVDDLPWSADSNYWWLHRESRQVIFNEDSDRPQH
jgi:FkbM family methyltransferase